MWMLWDRITLRSWLYWSWFGCVQVMYFSSVFPYVVLLCFLIRGAMLDGASEGIKFMFYPRVRMCTHTWTQTKLSVLEIGVQCYSYWLEPSFSWRSWRTFRCGVRRRLRSFLLLVWASVRWSRTPPTTRGTTIATVMPSQCPASTSWRLFWPRWSCLPCWDLELKPSPQTVPNGQYAKQ